MSHVTGKLIVQLFFLQVEPKEGQKTHAERLKDEKWHKARRNTIKTLAIVSLW